MKKGDYKRLHFFAYIILNEKSSHDILLQFNTIILLLFTMLLLFLNITLDAGNLAVSELTHFHNNRVTGVEGQRYKYMKGFVCAGPYYEAPSGTLVISITPEIRRVISLHEIRSLSFGKIAIIL